MNLVRFFRKKRTTIMTWAVIILMIAFVGGTAFQQIMSQVSIWRAPKKAIFDDGLAIRDTHIRQATAELEILRAIRMDVILAMRGQDQNQPQLASQLLAMLLFPDSINAASVNSYLKQSIQQGRLLLSEKQIDKYFNQTIYPNFYYWILLNHEAAQMGIQLTRDDAMAFLDGEISRITQNQASGQVLLNQVLQETNLTREQILEVARKMISIITYVDTITSTANMTTRQMKAATQARSQRFTGEYIQLAAGDFIDDIYSPTEDQVRRQFEQFKDTLPGEITAANPYGFGYKLPPALRLEYVVYELDQLRDIIEPVTSDQKEDFYTRNTSMFREEIPVDPNNPEGEKTIRLQSYVEVESRIEQQLIFDRIRKKSDLIISDLRSFLNAGYVENEIQPDQATSRQLEQYSRSFEDAARQIEQKYAIDLAASKTGMLTYQDARRDNFLRSMVTEGQAGTAVMVNRVLYAMDPLNITTLNRFEMDPPDRYEIMGPVMGTGQKGEEAINIVGLIRVIETRPETVPSGLDQTVSAQGISLDQTQEPEKTTIEEKVIEDLKLVHAMDVTEQKARQLSEMIQNDGWEKALEQFNEKFRSDDQTPVEIQKLRGQTRASQMDLYIQSKRAGEIAAANYLQLSRLIDEFEKHLPPMERDAENVNEVIPFEPMQSVYILKDLSRNDVRKDQYERFKPMMAWQFESMSSESAVLDFLSPDNIKIRTNFEPVAMDLAEQPEEEAPQEL